VAVLKRHFLIFAIMFSQTLLAILCGLAVLFLYSGQNTAPQVRVGSLEAGGLSRQEAIRMLESTYGNVFERDYLKIRYNGTEEYDIRYTDINARLNVEATLEAVYGRNGTDKLLNLVRGYFSSRERAVMPVVTLDEQKLRNKLAELALLIDKEPINARIYLKDDKVVKHPEINGLRLNAGHAVSKLVENISLHPEAMVELLAEANYEIETVVPEYSSENFNGVEDILVRYSTDILSPSEVNSIKTSIAAINRVLIYAADTKKGEPAGEFSFNKYIARADARMEKNNEGYNQVASTLYAAILSAGIQPGAITRTRHEVTVDYIDPGLDVMIFGESVDFKFKNTLDSNLIIFAYVKEDKVNICIAGKKPKDVVLNTVKTEIVQKYEPTVIHVENRELKPGEKKLITPGREGVKVDVYLVPEGRVAIKQGSRIYTLEYKPVDAMVQIGPNTGWEHSLVK
jgi:vancomycin resistance protein YoaR